MNNNIIVSDLKIIFNDNGEHIFTSAIINGELHYTPDNREFYKNDIIAVFSEITKFNEKINGSTKECVEKGIYKEYPIEKLLIWEDYFIYIKLDIKAFNERNILINSD